MLSTDKGFSSAMLADLAGGREDHSGLGQERLRQDLWVACWYRRTEGPGRVVEVDEVESLPESKQIRKEQSSRLIYRCGS